MPNMSHSRIKSKNGSWKMETVAHAGTEAEAEADTKGEAKAE